MYVAGRPVTPISLDGLSVPPLGPLICLHWAGSIHPLVALVIVIELNIRRKRAGVHLNEGRVVNLAGEIGGFVEKHDGSADVAGH